MFFFSSMFYPEKHFLWLVKKLACIIIRIIISGISRMPTPEKEKETFAQICAKVPNNLLIR